MLSFAGYLFWRESRPRELLTLGTIANAKFTTSDRQEFELSQLKGKVWVADFIFTTCGGICPIMSKNMAQLHRSYVLLDDVRMVSISVNPEQDTPEVLQEYAKRYKADTARWLFLTAPREVIQDLAVHSFKMGSIDEPIFHSSKFVLVDREMKIRGYYDGTTAGDIARLYTDVASLLKERNRK